MELYSEPITEKPHVYEYTCLACNDGFDPKFGVSIDTETFCNECVNEHKHIDFYRSLDLSDSEIYNLLSTTRSL